MTGKQVLGKKTEALILQGLPHRGLYWTRTSDPIDVNDGRSFFARLICFRTIDKFDGINCRICIAILIHIEDQHDDLVHVTPGFLSFMCY